MSLCRFQFPFNGTREALVERIREHLSRAGGSLSGSAAEGTYSLFTPVGSFRGSYRTEGQTIFLEVDDKPFFVPCGAIESRLAQYVRDAVERD